MKSALTVLTLFSLSELNFSLFRKHFFVSEKMNWTSAQRHCRAQHDDLSTVSPEEALLLSTNPQITSGFFWIGLHQSPDTNEWIWSGGQHEAIAWDSGEPNLFREHCGALIVVKENKTWDEALDYCRQHYTDLVSLSSEEVITEVVNNVVTSQTARVWTGLRFLAGHWFWVSGEDLQYEAWSTEGEVQCPAGDLRCGALDRENHTWSPRNCEEKLNFVCFVNA